MTAKDGQQLADEGWAIGLAKSHAPTDWQGKFPAARLAHHLLSDEPVDMIVLAGDIRKSTALMKEAVSFKTWAITMGTFVDAVASHVKSHGGWFDKFTGDGFLAYWILATPEDRARLPLEVTLAAARTMSFFSTEVMDAFRVNSRNFPIGIGLSLGLDGGPTYFEEVAGELTIVGLSVVGAVRMVAAAAPRELVCNVFMGQELFRNTSLVEGADGAFSIEKTTRPTKEYLLGQEMYSVTFPTDEDRR